MAKAKTRQLSATRKPRARAHHLAAPRKTMQRAKRVGMVLLFLCLISTGMGQSLFFALLPPMARDLGLSEIQVSSIFTLSAILWVTLSPYWGRKSDDWGRKPVILMGILGFGISTASVGLLILFGMSSMIPITTMYIAIILARAIFGAFGSGTPSAAQAYIADITPRKERTEGMATIGAAFGMGTVLGPGFAAALAAIHFLVPFFVLATIAFLSAIAVWLILPERRRSHRPARRQSTVRLSPFARRIFPFVFMGVVISLAQAAIIQVAAFFVLDVMGADNVATAQLVGIAMMSMAMMTLLAQLVIIPYLRLSVRQLLIVGAGITALAFALLLFPPNPGLFVFALTLEGLGTGLLRPAIAAGASLSVGAKEQGAAAGLINSTAGFGIIFVPILVMPLYLVLPQAPFMLATGLMLVILLFSLLPGFRHLETDLDIATHDKQVLARPEKL